MVKKRRKSSKHSGQYLQRSGCGRNSQEPFRTLRQDTPAAAVHFHQPAGHLHLYQHTDGLPHSSIEIANLSQGTFVGSVADNFGEEIDQKIFHARIIVDNEKVAAETKAYKKIPVINEFKDADGNDIMQQQIDRNYSQIKADVVRIIEDEITRIKNDPDLKHLIPQEENDKDNE